MSDDEISKINQPEELVSNGRVNKPQSGLNSQINNLITFKTREYEEIIKNPNCSFMLEETDKCYYYFCLCSEEAYSPICESCAFTCHKDHNPQIKIEGFFTCNCGLKNHKISEKNQKRFEEKSNKIQECFYSGFYKKCYNKGFFQIKNDEKILCSICFFSSDCNNNISQKEKYENKENYTITNYQGDCQCERHYETNVVTMSNELNKNIVLSSYMLNFNFNIISICPSTRNIFIDFLNDKIRDLLDYEEKKKQMEEYLLKKRTVRNFDIKNSEPVNSLIFDIYEKRDPYIVFNTDFVIFTVFNIFNIFKKRYTSQYFHVKNIFSKQIKPFHLIEILKKTANFQRLLDYNENTELYFKTKANFAFMIFQVYIKAHFLNFNNLFNLKSLLNLNIVQRVLYIHQSKKFYKFNSHSQNIKGNKNIDKLNKSDSDDIPLYDFDGKLENFEIFVLEFANEIINIIETMLQVHDNSPIIKNVMSDVMVVLGKIMKFLIKYNLIDEALKEKFFEILQDTLVAFVNELDNSAQEYNDLIVQVSSNIKEEDQENFEMNFSHKQRIEYLEKNEQKSLSEKLEKCYLENENLKNKMWFTFPAIKCTFYHSLKKNDDLVIKKLKGQFSKTQSQETYCFITNGESDTLSKIFLLTLKIFNENAYSNKNEQSVYKKKILKFDLYVKKILELLNGNNEFYLKSLESIIYQFKRKIDSLFIQDFGDEKKNNPETYIQLMKSNIFNQNNYHDKQYNETNMKILLSEEDYHKEILKNLNLELFLEFKDVNVDFGNLNKKFFEYEIDFTQFTLQADRILERFKMIFEKLDLMPEKNKKRNSSYLVSNFIKNKRKLNYNKSSSLNINSVINSPNGGNPNDKGESNNINIKERINLNNNNPFIQVDYKNLRADSVNISNIDRNKQNEISKSINNSSNISNIIEEYEEEDSINAVDNLVLKYSHTKKSSFKKLNDFKKIISFTDFLENFNEFLDIYARSKSFDSEMNAINIKYDLLKFFLNLLYLIADDNNENLVLIMTINPIKLVDAFFDYKEELCLLLSRVSSIVSKFDYNDNYFFLTDFMNALIAKLEITNRDGMSQGHFAVFTSILKSFKKLLPKYNIHNDELINTYEIICNKIIELKNNEIMTKKITDFINNLFINGSSNTELKEDSQRFIIHGNTQNSIIYDNLDVSKKSNNNLNIDYDEGNYTKNSIINVNNEENILDNKLILNENLPKNDKDASVDVESINGTLLMKNNLKNNKHLILANEGNEMKHHSDNYIFEAFFKHYFALLNIAFEKDLYYYDLFYDKEIILINKNQLKDVVLSSADLSISFRGEVERFLHNYNLKNKVKFTTLEREFAKYQTMSNSEKGNLKFIFSGKFKDCLSFSCNLMDNQMKNFIKNTNLTLFFNNNTNKFSNVFNNLFSKNSRNKINNLNKIVTNNIKIKEVDNDNNLNNQDNLKNVNNNNMNNNYILNNSVNKNGFLNKKLNNLVNGSNNNPNYPKVKINSVFSYLENAIINPLFKIINLFMLTKEELLGDDYFQVYKLVFYLHQLLYKLYNIDIKDMEKKRKKKKNRFKDFEYVDLSKYFYCNLKKQLNETNMEYLNKNLNKLKDLRYFQFEEIVNIFRVTLAIIKKNNTFNFIHLQKKFYRFNVIENSFLECYEYNEKDSIFINFYNEIIENAVDYFLGNKEKKLYYIIEEYKKTLGESFGKDFSLIKVLDSTDLDCEVDLTGIIFHYLINKFADGLTRANQELDIKQNVFTFDKAYKDNELKNIYNKDFESNKKTNNENEVGSEREVNDYKKFVEGRNLKIQNFYVMFYLRNFFLFDPEKFQESLLNLFSKVVYKSSKDNENDESEEEREYINSDERSAMNNISMNKKISKVFSNREFNLAMRRSSNKQINDKRSENNNEEDDEEDDEEDGEKIEEIFEIDKEKISYFFSIINKYFIFGNLICEAGKFFELYNERTLLRSNYVYDLLITNIYLMQNICEGHNQTTQNLMFDLRLKPELENLKSTQNDNSKLLNNQKSLDPITGLQSSQNLNQRKKKIKSFDKEKIKIEKFFSKRKDFKFSYINFLSNLMRNIAGCLYFDYDNRYVFINKTFALNSNFICVFNKLSDLLIEMIQGTQEYNLYNFYIPKSDKDRNYIPSSENLNKIRNFQFLVFLYDIKQLLLKDGDDPEKDYSIIKSLTFSILNNILNQENVNADFIRVILNIFDIEFLVGKMSVYMKKLLVRYQQGILYEHPQFSVLVKELNFKDYYVDDFYKIFLREDELQQDDYFRICVQLYYFINICGDKYYMQEAINILDLEDSITKMEDNDAINEKEQQLIISSNLNTNKLEIENTVDLKSNKHENKIKIFFEKTLRKNNLFRKSLNQSLILNNNNDIHNMNNMNDSVNPTPGNQEQQGKLFNDINNNENKNKEESDTANQIINNLEKKDLVKTAPLIDVLYTKIFYSQIVNSVEFVIEDDNKANVKEIYFIKNPVGYLINETNIENFFKNADRSDATTKITSLLDSLQNFQIEINYKLNIKNRFKRYLLRYDYKITDFISLILALIINLILLFSLTILNVDDTDLRQPIYNIVLSIGLLQIFVNFISLIIFLIIKQDLWVSYALNNIKITDFSYLGNSIVDNDIILSKISLSKKLKVYLIDCFLLNEEIILINFNLILASIGISQFYASVIFSLQLITISRFVETIRDIVIAFRSRFDQLIAMVFFLVFLIYFYTNLGFYFLNEEYNDKETSKGDTENPCSSLIRCFIYHFNEGVRSGGGIGDVLDQKSWDNLGLYFGRWMLDMIFFVTVLLLLLNMINGIIVSTFSAIREDSEQKADDMENRCFICSIDKAEFEKRKISFENHIKKEHNVKHYINFIIYLRLTPNKNLDSNQGYIKECIENRDINVFPIYQSKALGTGKFDKTDED